MMTKKTVSKRYPTADDPIVLIQRFLPSFCLSFIQTSTFAFASSPSRKDIREAITMRGTYV